MPPLFTAPLFNEQWRHATLFSEQLRHAPLFTEQCSMVELLIRARKQQLAAFLRPAFHTQFIVDP